MTQSKYNRFPNLRFEDFRRMATDENLSCYEKIGFPNEYRQGKEHLIFEDIVSKLPLLNRFKQTVLDIGPDAVNCP